MFMEAVEAHNEAHDPKAGKHEPASPEFVRFMKDRFARG
jgi:hypothetical protein